jgi:ABC-type transport system involved in multi-copper enzyme maturation permease subunit
VVMLSGGVLVFILPIFMRSRTGHTVLLMLMGCWLIGFIAYCWSLFKKSQREVS